MNSTYIDHTFKKKSQKRNAGPWHDLHLQTKETNSTQWTLSSNYLLTSYQEWLNQGQTCLIMKELTDAIQLLANNLLLRKTDAPVRHHSRSKAKVCKARKTNLCTEYFVKNFITLGKTTLVTNTKPHLS